ncbi:MAG TPA: LLM class F420-dependent oxidoreductase, partial [Mycobacterium sp.]|nr:LLM class F420-dependent oxidoreductase [Mycobacterium sp.]
DAALRRAARNDGWMHGGGSAEELDELLAKLKGYREAEGRTGDFQVHVISMDAYTPDGIKRLEDKGVTDVMVGFRLPYIIGPDTQPLQDKIRNLEKYADKVMSKV